MKPANKNITLRSVDEMTLGFTGVAGFHFWDGRDPELDGSYHTDLWKNTFRAQNHMDGNDVINTLSDTWGGWSHGMETTFLKISTGVFSNDKPELLEQQNYVSSDKTKFVGYVKNRSYNVRTRGCSNITFQIPYAPQFYIPRSITWVAPPTLKRLKIDGLQNGEHYSILWYSFINGDYMKTDCLKATNGNIRLEFPILTASSSGTMDNPVLWFVAQKSSCNQNKSANLDDSTKTIPDRGQMNELKHNMIYPNPFKDYFIVISQQADIFILQSLEGTIIGEFKVGKGETRITKILSIGLYIGRLQKQSQTFKIIKQ
jgi:hypothetical protein